MRRPDAPYRHFRAPKRVSHARNQTIPSDLGAQRRQRRLSRCSPSRSRSWCRRSSRPTRSLRRCVSPVPEAPTSRPPATAPPRSGQCSRCNEIDQRDRWSVPSPDVPPWGRVGCRSRQLPHCTARRDAALRSELESLGAIRHLEPEPALTRTGSTRRTGSGRTRRSPHRLPVLGWPCSRLSRTE
jgi:hypothetical protein